MVQYYTLEQAAKILRTTVDELKEMARQNKVRAFQDRGTLRFRAQEIEELARSRGFGSDPELPLGETAAPPRKTGMKSPSPAGLDATAAMPASEVPLGKDPSSKSGLRGTSSPRPSRLSKSPPPKAANDSDVRLVLDGSDLDFHIELDSADQLKSPSPASPRPSQLRSTPSDSPRPGRKSRLGPSEEVDSGVRMVPMEPASDSDVKLPPPGVEDRGDAGTGGGSDSDIRTEGGKPRSGSRRKSDLVTEEIDLDAEQARRAEAEDRSGTRRRSGPPILPTSSPFELSSLDLDLDAPAARHAPPPGTDDSSSDYDLSPLPSDSALQLPIESDEVELGDLGPANPESSGINLQEPVDSGISLENEGTEELSFVPGLDADAGEEATTSLREDSAFELNLDGSDDMPSIGTEDSSSDFELTLDTNDSSPVSDESSSDFEFSLEGSDEDVPSPAGSSSDLDLSLGEDGAQTDSSSDFELTLDGEGSSPLAIEEGSSELALEEDSPQAGDSDSEFELTLDDSGSLAAAEEGSEESQDIFETDFDVPSLDDESGSEAVALDEADTDLESSEFDLTSDEESGSQVVPLEDEEDADEGAATVQRRIPRQVAADEEEGELDELDQDLDLEPAEEEELEEEEPVAAAPTAAPWGPLPAILLMPTFFILFVVALMSFELFQGMWGFHRGSKVSNLIIDPITEKVWGDKLPTD